MSVIWLMTGFAFLVLGANWLVDGASSLAKRWRVSNLVIGLTIVGFGTSMPELLVNIFASFGGNPEIAIGNILGSNIVNILLILGISALIYPLTVTSNTVWKEIPFSLLAAVLVFVMANDRLIDRVPFSSLTRIDGVVFLAFFVIFVYYAIAIARDNCAEGEAIVIKQFSTSRSLLWILLGLTGLILGGHFVVREALNIARQFGINESVIGLTIVAVGTSLPELFTSAVAAYKKQPDIAVGNVIGSNIFNIFFILGISALIRPLPFLPEHQTDMMMTIVSSVLLFFFMFTGSPRRIDRWEGFLLIVVYVSYLVSLLARVKI